MTIYTYCEEEYAREFQRLKRKTSGSWKFLVSGEWSQDRYHESNCSYSIRWSVDMAYWALLLGGFPKRIVAVAHTPEPIRLEVIAATMMLEVKSKCGDFIDYVEAFGKIDADLFWRVYRQK